MASKKNREVKFTLTDDDYRSFGRYRIMYTAQGRAMVRRQRLTYLITAVMIVILFSFFHVDKTFTYLMYVIAAALAVVGIIFAEKFVLTQQDKVIEASKNDPERVFAGEYKVVFDDDTFTTISGKDEQTFEYKQIQLIDLTEEAIYVWMSDTAIMSLPRHAFSSMDEMKSTCKWLREKVKEQGGNADTSK